MSKTIVAIGEALWDVFPNGRQPGGAPCNVAYHAACLGNRGIIVTRVGNDAAGDDLVSFLRARRVVTDYVQRDDTKPTGTVSVTIQNGEPRYEITEQVAWDYMTAGERERVLMRGADAVCIGSLAQRSEVSREAIQRLLSEARKGALIVFDVNLRPPFINADVITAILQSADVVKMNESEASELRSMFDQSSLDGWLIDTLGVKVVCVTRGKTGASITTRQGTTSASGFEIDTSAGDAVGAGDAFTAAMAHQLVRDATPQETLRVANRYAAVIASKQGAMPVVSPEELAGIGL